MRFKPIVIKTALAIAFFAICGDFALHVAPQALAAPQPAPVPRRWQLDFRPGPLRLASISTPETGPRTYFYLTYTVINNSGQDQVFAPSFELSTPDDGTLLRSGQDVSAAVVQELQKRLKIEDLKDEISMMGTLLQGEENARDGLVVWQAPNLMVDEVVVFAAGFSGETRTIKRPDTGEDVVLRKVMMLRHDTPGDLTGHFDETLERSTERWILR